MRLCTLVLASTALVALCATTAESAPSVPWVPQARHPEGMFTEIHGVWGFSGCARGPLGGAFASRSQRVGCASGRLTLGTREFDGNRWVHAWMDLDVRSHSRLASPLTAEYGDAQLVFGSFLAGACPPDRVATTPCEDVVLASPVHEFGAGRISWDDLLYVDDGARFRPDVVQLNLTYTLEDGSSVRPRFAARGLQLKPVGPDSLPGITTAPEPGTWALLGTGLLAIGLVARRRRG